MKSTKITPPIIAVIGVVMCLLAAGGLFYFLIMPTQNDTTAYQARLDAASADATPAAQANAKKDAAQAIVDVKNTQAKWAIIENTLMPPYDVSQRYRAWKQISNEMSLYLGPDLENYMTTTGKTTGVVPLTTIALPPPPADPNAVTAAPLVIPLGGTLAAGGNLTVGGSFRQILHHVQLWNSFNRLVLVDNLALHGNSPYMKGEYGASVIIFPQNDDKLDKPIPTAATGTANPNGP